MELGVAVLLFGLIGIGVIAAVPQSTRRAAGGALILITGVVIALMLLGAL